MLMVGGCVWLQGGEPTAALGSVQPTETWEEAVVAKVPELAWLALVSGSTVFSGAHRLGMRVLLLGYHGAPGSSAQLLAGGGIDFFFFNQRAVPSVWLCSSRVWAGLGPGSCGWLS